MLKRGQVALYFIVGLFLFIIISSLLYLKNESFKSKFNELIGISIIPKELAEVSQFIEDCLTIIAKDSLYQVGRNGGYSEVPNSSSIIWFTEQVPYYYLNNRSLTPNINKVETELSNNIKENLGSCLNYSNFKQQGFKINHSDYSIQSKISNESVKIIMSYKINIQKGKVRKELNKFEIDLNSNLKEMLTTSKELVSTYSKKPGFVCLNCIQELAENKEISISMLPVNDVSIFNNDIIWVLIDDKEFPIDKVIDEFDYFGKRHIENIKIID